MVERNIATTKESLVVQKLDYVEDEIVITSEKYTLFMLRCFGNHGEMAEWFKAAVY